MTEHQEHVLHIMRKINHGLCAFLVVFVLYLVVDPFLPEVAWQVKNLSGKNVYAQTLEEGALPNLPPMPAPRLTPGMHRLYIPKLGIHQEIIESTQLKGIGHKLWRRPNTSTPPRGKRTVLVGHRYASIGGKTESVFYHLPKLEVGDTAYVYWDDKVYTYEVYQKRVVKPTAVQVEFASAEPELTFITCTPLFLATNRLVVDAKLISTTPIAPETLLLQES